MNKWKKALVIYLVVSSVILHTIAAFAIVTIGPAIKSGIEMGNEFAKISAGKATNIGVIKDICTLKDGEYSYVGYALEYKGQTLYVMGTDGGVQKGDQVAVTISKHPYEPLKTLMITVSKNGP